MLKLKTRLYILFITYLILLFSKTIQFELGIFILLGIQCIFFIIDSIYYYRKSDNKKSIISLISAVILMLPFGATYIINHL